MKKGNVYFRTWAVLARQVPTCAAKEPEGERIIKKERKKRV